MEWSFRFLIALIRLSTRTLYIVHNSLPLRSCREMDKPQTRRNARPLPELRNSRGLIAPERQGPALHTPGDTCKLRRAVDLLVLGTPGVDVAYSTRSQPELSWDNLVRGQHVGVSVVTHLPPSSTASRSPAAAEPGDPCRPRRW